MNFFMIGESVHHQYYMQQHLHHLFDTRKRAPTHLFLIHRHLLQPLHFDTHQNCQKLQILVLHMYQMHFLHHNNNLLIDEDCFQDCTRMMEHILLNRYLMHLNRYHKFLLLHLVLLNRYLIILRTQIQSSLRLRGR